MTERTDNTRTEPKPKRRAADLRPLFPGFAEDDLPAFVKVPKESSHIQEYGILEVDWEKNNLEESKSSKVPADSSSKNDPKSKALEESWNARKGTYAVPIYYNTLLIDDKDKVKQAIKSAFFETWVENMKQNDELFTAYVVIDLITYHESNPKSIKYIKINAHIFNKESVHAELDYHCLKKFEDDEKAKNKGEGEQNKDSNASKDNKGSNESKDKKDGPPPQKARTVAGVCFLRGPRVGVMVVIPTEVEEFTVLTVNRRIAVAKPAVPELPTGTIDEAGDFVGEAADRLHKELHIRIKEMDMVDLTQLAFGRTYPGMFPSAGGCDEYVRLYLYRDNPRTAKDLAKLKAELDLKLGEDSGRLRVVSMKELWKVTPDSSALSALAIYSRLKQPGIL